MRKYELSPGLLRELRRLVKYCVTGLTNTVISYVCYAVLTYAVHFSSLALAISYIIGMISSYVLNSRWTFGQRKFDSAYLYRFIIANIILLLINESLLTMTQAFIVDSKLIAQAIDLIPMTLLGYVANRTIVFKIDSQGVSSDEYNVT